MKKCNKCKETKPLEEFHRNKKYSFGRACQCRSCAREEYLKRSGQSDITNKELNNKERLKIYNLDCSEHERAKRAGLSVSGWKQWRDKMNLPLRKHKNPIVYANVYTETAKEFERFLLKLKREGKIEKGTVHKALSRWHTIKGGKKREQTA